MTEIRNILLFGRTGQGKSSVSNVLTGTNEFKESAGSTSETKGHQVKSFQKGNITYQVIDTIGLGDSRKTESENLYELAKVASKLGDGVNQVFFVTNGRFAKEEVDAFNILCKVFFDPSVAKYSSIIRTNFPEFYKDEECKNDIKDLTSEGQAGKKVVEEIGEEAVIHIDLPPLKGRDGAVKVAKETREESREKLLKYLENKTEIYNPNNLKKINSRIRTHLHTKEIDVKKTKITELEEKLKTTKNLEEKGQINEQINTLRTEANDLIAKEKKAFIDDMAKHIIESFQESGEQMISMFPGLGRELGTVASIGAVGISVSPLMIKLIIGKIFGFI